MRYTWFCEWTRTGTSTINPRKTYPCQYNAVLFGNAFVLKNCSNLCVFFNELEIRNSTMVNVVNKSCQYDRKLSKRIGCNSIGMIVKLRRQYSSIFAMIENFVRSHNSSQEFAYGHHNMTCVFKIVKWVIPVSKEREVRMTSVSSWEDNRACYR